MKKNFNAFLAACAALAIVFSCTKAENPVYGSQDGENSVLAPLGQVTVDALLNDLNTKVSFAPTYVDGKPESVVLAWAAGDKLRIYNHADRTQYADLELDATCVGQKRGLFSGEITFAASSYDVEVFNGTLDYAVQTQPSDASAASLKYLASASAVASLTAINFTEYSSVLAIAAKMPQGVAAQVTSVDITASDNVFNGGKTLTINLAQKGDAEGDDILHLFATLPQGSQEIVEGTSLLVKFNAPDTDHKVYTRYVELGASDFAAGKLNTINVNATASATHAGVVSCDGSSEKAYLVGDVYQMQAVKALLSADALTYVELVDDIDLKDVAWTSIDAKVNLNGNNHTISNLKAPLFNDLKGDVANLTIANTNLESAGTIGILANTANTTACNVSGVCLNACTLKSTENVLVYVGCLVGEVSSPSNFDDCNIIGTTLTKSGNSSYAGLAFGYVHNADAKIGCTKGCSIDNTSKLEGKDFSGGFIGVLEGGTVKNCTVNCPVSGYSKAGGFVGYLKSGELDANAFKGAFTGGYQNTGGLIGLMDNGTVKNCSATGGLTFTAKVNYALVGGLVGCMSNGTLEHCYVTGRVEGYGKHVGGLCGHITGKVKLDKCYADVEVVQLSGATYGRNTGGFIGEAASEANVEISNCYVKGSVTSTQTYVGAFIGNLLGVTKVTNCYSKCTLSGSSKYSTTVFAGSATADKLEMTGYIGWDISGNKTADIWWFGGPETLENNIIVTDINTGSISAEATKMGWDTSIWDLSGDDPKLK